METVFGYDKIDSTPKAQHHGRLTPEYLVSQRKPDTHSLMAFCCVPVDKAAVLWAMLCYAFSAMMHPGSGARAPGSLMHETHHNEVFELPKRRMVKRASNLLEASLRVK